MQIYDGLYPMDCSHSWKVVNKQICITVLPIFDVLIIPCCIYLDTVFCLMLFIMNREL